MDHVLCSNLFLLQQVVQRRGAILKVLFCIFEVFWFGPQDLIISSLFLFEEKIHRKNLSRVEAIPLLFPRLFSYVLKHLGFPVEPHHELHCEYEATFIVEKWNFMPGAIPLPAFPLSEEDQ